MKQRWREKHPPPIEPTRREIIESRISIDPESGCWLWTGSMHAEGYGCYGKPAQLAHRMSYEEFVGPIPDGLTLDHVRERGCSHRHCVNPAHLEPVTLAVNVMRGDSLPAKNARKTHCPQGHPYDEENTYVNPRTGWRLCRACNRARGVQRGR